MASLVTMVIFCLFVCHLFYFVCSAEMLRHAAGISFVPEGPGSSPIKRL